MTQILDHGPLHFFSSWRAWDKGGQTRSAFGSSAADALAFRCEDVAADIEPRARIIDAAIAILDDFNLRDAAAWREQVAAATGDPQDAPILNEDAAILLVDQALL
jgi:hypothetical protein